jgi:hypothetical protein
MFGGEVKERRSQPAVALSTSFSEVVPRRLITPKHRQDHGGPGLGFGLGLRRKTKTKGGNENDADNKGKDEQGAAAGDHQSNSRPNPKGTKADLARRIKSLSLNAETPSLELEPHQIQALQEEAARESQGDHAGVGSTQAGENAEARNKEEEDEEMAWARTTWFRVYEGKVLRTQDAPSKEVYSSSGHSSTIFYQSMLSAGEWMSSERLTVYDIGLLVRSRVAQQRCFAYDVVKRILETSVHIDSVAERFTYENAIQYFVRVGGLHETLLSDMNGSNARACQSSFAVISDMVLPSLLANCLAQKKSFLSWSKSSADTKHKANSALLCYQKELAEKISKGCILSEIIKGNANSDPFSLSLVKVMLVLETQGHASYLGSREDTRVILSFLSSRLQQAKSVSIKVHIVWLLCVISERDPSVLSEHLGDGIFDVIESLYDATRSKGSYMEYTIQAFTLHFQNSHLSKYWNKAWDMLAQVSKSSAQGSQATAAIDIPTLILIENLFSMLSKGKITNLMGESQQVEAICSASACLELVLQAWKSVDERSDSFLYCLSAITSGMAFYDHLVTTSTGAQGVKSEDLTNATQGLHDMLTGVIPALVKCCSKVFKDLVHQDIKQGKVIQGFDTKHSGTKFLHSTWHKVVCDFLLLSLKPLGDKGAALESAWKVLETHRMKTFVIHSDEDLKDCHATIFSELLANHYNLLGTAIDVFLNLSGACIPLEKIVTTWDCAADALFYWSTNTKNQFISAGTLFSSKILVGILEKRKEILQKYMNGAFPLNGVEPDLNQKIDHIDTMDITRKIHAVVSEFKGRDLSPDWMFGLHLCGGKQELYPLILLFLLCVELSGSRYLLGLPVNMKLSKILAEAYCRSNSLFEEESSSFLSIVVGFHLTQMDNEMYNSEAIIQKGYELRLSPSIVDQFTSVSYGDTLFGLAASLAFSNVQSIPDQMEAWKNVAASDVFDVFPPFSYYGDLVKLFFGWPRSVSLVESCFDTLLMPSMEKAVKRECITAFFAVHYVSEFCFTEMNEDNCHKIKLSLSDGLSKQKKLIHQALVFLDETMLQVLFRYSFEDSVPKFKDLSQRKIEMWKRIVGHDRLPSFLAHDRT